MRRLVVVMFAGVIAACSSSGPPSPPPRLCPPTVPTNGAPCTNAQAVCTYIDCSSFGVATVSCVSGAWFVTTGACATVPCGQNGSTPCAPGQICLERRGGADLFDCVSDLCPDGGIECACVCGGSCLDPSGGVRWTCNACPSGMCP